MKWLVPLLTLGLLFFSTSARAVEMAKVQFTITIPYDTPKGDIFISGNHEALGNWDPSKIKFHRKDRTCTLELSFPVGTVLEFKFTRGSWETVEKSINGQEIPNRVLTVTKNGATYQDKVASWRDVIEANGGKLRGSTLSGVFQYHENFQTPGLLDRTIIVYLPTDYDKNPDKKYPVLYMHDGNNLFDARTSFAGEWEVDETIKKLVANNQMQEIIVVGIYNTKERIAEYTPVPDPSHGGGQGKIYADFVVKTLKPFIDSKYRTLTDREHTGVMGSSLGGLISLYIGQEYPEVFGLIGAMSPSVWWSKLQILQSFGDFLQNYQGPKPKIWLDCGTSEETDDRDGDGINDMLDDTRNMRDLLLKNGYVTDVNLGYFEAQYASHSEIAWASRVWRPLVFFFGK